MSTVRLNYDGWLALPATVRQRLGLITGDRLDLELVDGVITLRPRRADAPPQRPAPPAGVSRGGAARGAGGSRRAVRLRHAGAAGRHGAGQERRRGPAGQVAAPGDPARAQG